MAELDGVWDVKRTGGFLPPMTGVRKRISGRRGTTRVGDAVGVPFDVVGLELRYRAPFTGFVDVLTPAAGGFHGHSTFRGHEFGRFELTRSAAVSSTSIDELLVKQIDEAQAMEQNVLRLLDGMISSTGDAALRAELEQHRSESEGHARLMRTRLAAHGATPSTVRQLGGIVGALAKVPLDLVRGEQAGRHARDAYATEHLEIASYELLRRVAEAAGDVETAAACDEILAQERAMAESIAASWDKVLGLQLGDSTAPETAAGG